MEDLFGLQNYADTRFEKMGVHMQMDANSWEAAKSQYEKCCLLCCTKEVGAMQCASCKIREAFLLNAELIFRSKLTTEDRDWVKKEKELL